MNKFLYFNGSLILTSLSLLFPTHAMDEKLSDEIEILNNTSLTKISVREEDGKTKEYPLNPIGQYTTIQVESPEETVDPKGGKQTEKQIFLSIPEVSKQISDPYFYKYADSSRISRYNDCYTFTLPTNPRQLVLTSNWANIFGERIIGFDVVENLEPRKPEVSITIRNKTSMSNFNFGYTYNKFEQTCLLGRPGESTTFQTQEEVLKSEFGPFQIPRIDQHLDTSKMGILAEYNRRGMHGRGENPSPYVTPVGPDFPTHEGGWLRGNGDYVLTTHPQNSKSWVLEESYADSKLSYFHGKLIGYRLVADKAQGEDKLVSEDLSGQISALQIENTSQKGKEKEKEKETKN